MVRSTYREAAPPGWLSDRVMCLWTQEIDPAGGPYTHAVLPDGCVDIVWIGDAAPIVAGPVTHRSLVPLAAGTRLQGVRLRPGWAARCLGLPACELLGHDVPLADVCGWCAPMRLPDALHRIGAAGMADGVLLHAVAWLAANPAGKVRELAGATGMSSRQLQRRFIEAVGYAPKTFQRIVRFQMLLASAAWRSDLAALAAGAGYADQSHMCREVLELAGEPAGKLLGRVGTTLAMSDLFNTGGPGEVMVHE